MPHQFQQAEDAAPLRTGASEPITAPSLAETTSATRFTQDQVQRILAEATRLQTYFRETLSQSEVEAIAQEIGIAPNFVRQAIKQDGVAIKPSSHRRKRLSVPHLQPMPFHAVAKNAILPILYACLLISTTSWQPESGFANWFLFLYTVLPPLLAFSTGFLSRKIRMGAASGAFWGLGILFALILPNSIKIYQSLDNAGPVEVPQLLSETGMILGMVLLYGAAFGIAGVLTRRGVVKGLKWYGKQRSKQAEGNNAILRGI